MEQQNGKICHIPLPLARQLMIGKIFVLGFKILKMLLHFLAPVLSGVLIVMAFPKYDLWWLAWVGLVPIMATISDKRPRYGFFSSFLFGIVFFALIHEWMFEIPGYKVLQHAILSIYFGLYFGIFGLTFSSISKHKGIIRALLTAPFIWVALEYLTEKNRVVSYIENK